MDHETQQQYNQNEPENNELTRDLNQEREKFERMIERQSEASREYNMGKLLSA